MDRSRTEQKQQPNTINGIIESIASMKVVHLCIQIRRLFIYLFIYFFLPLFEQNQERNAPSGRKGKKENVVQKKAKQRKQSKH